MGYIFISPYANQFWVDFKFFLLICILEKKTKWIFFIWIFFNAISHMTNDVILNYHLKTIVWSSGVSIENEPPYLQPLQIHNYYFTSIHFHIIFAHWFCTMKKGKKNYKTLFFIFNLDPSTIKWTKKYVHPNPNF
jgi:hypothetical protein